MPYCDALHTGLAPRGLRRPQTMKGRADAGRPTRTRSTVNTVLGPVRRRPRRGRRPRGAALGAPRRPVRLRHPHRSGRGLRGRSPPAAPTSGPQGGGTIVDSTGMFHGRDLRLYEALSRATGVHIVASTGMGPEEMLGGYFLTPRPTRRRRGRPRSSPTCSARRSPRAWSCRAWSAALRPAWSSPRSRAAGMTPTDESLLPWRGPRGAGHRRPGLDPVRRRRDARPRRRARRGAAAPTAWWSATSTARTPSRQGPRWRSPCARRLRRHRPHRRQRSTPHS